MTERNPDGKQILFIGMIYMSILLSSLTLGYKFVAFGKELYCGSVFIFPLLFNLGDVVAELYGRELSKNLIWFSLVSEAVFVLATSSIIRLPSPAAWPHQEAYNFIVGNYPRILIGDIIAIAASFYINVHLINKWKILLQGRYFFLRSIGATAIGEFVFTILTNLIAFIGVAALSDTIKIMFFDYLFKLIYSTIAAYPLSLLVAFIKIKRGDTPTPSTRKPIPFPNKTEENVLAFPDFKKASNQE